MADQGSSEQASAKAAAGAKGKIEGSAAPGAPLPPNEGERLAVLKECGILDTPADPDFDDLTRLAAQICGTPIALISLVDETRQWFKSRHGLAATETPRSLAFCAHALLNPEKLLVVPDATKDARFSANELVTGPLGIRFYAGAPLVVEEGLALGSLCVIDQQPRELTVEQRESLAALARQAVSQIQLRRQNFALREARVEREAFFNRPLDMLCIAGADGYFKVLNPAFTETLGFPAGELLAVPLFDFVHPDDVAATHAEMARALAGSPVVNFEHRFRCKDGSYRWLSWKCAPSPDGILYASARDVTEQRRLQERLEQQRHELEQFFTLPLDMLCVAKTDGYFKLLNPAFSEVLGYSTAELLAVPFLSLIHPDDVAGTLAETDRLSQGMLTVDFENRFRCKDGSYRWLSWKSSPAGDGLIYASARDVTERKETDARLRALSEFQRAILDSAAYAVIATTPEGVITAFNPAAERMLGYAAAELVGRATPGLFHDPGEVAGRAAMFSAELGCALEPGFEVFIAKSRRRLPNEHEWTYVRKDGGRLPVQLSVTALHDGPEKIVGFLGIAIDITERKRAAAALVASEKRFREAIEYSAIGMALVGLDGSWLKVNRALCAIVGRSEEELRRCTFQDITHPEDLDADLANVQALLAGTINHYQMEKRYLHRDGRLLWVLLAVTLVRDADGQPVHFVSQINDITERREAEDRLKASLAEKETLLKEVHHRVKNNLQVITSLLQLQSSSLRDPALLALFREAQDRVRAMALIHEGLYRSGNLAALDFGVHVRDLAATLLRSYAHHAAPARLEAETQSIHLDIDVAVPLSLIVNELITNAFKHSFADGRGGTLRIVFREEKAGLLSLSVGDDGPGLGADFDLATATSLGLKIVRTLTRQIGGTFEVQPRPGATFTITFPPSRSAPVSS